MVEKICPIIDRYMGWNISVGSKILATKCNLNTCMHDNVFPHFIARYIYAMAMYEILPTF